MASDAAAVTTGDEGIVSLYRRYRPGTFGSLRGQDHIVRALRSAVADDHVAHAYLFSGPRGTGKTSSARILARALNCEALVDGEPCGSCSSCLEIARGSSMDVIELDAASNNGVDAMRELIGHAALGSPGRHKVYIIDEVHMLSTSAANALLKTLEEPPPHVIFVLATTDPQKVPATIRSRTQHLEFRLLPAETIEQLLRDVRDDAHLELDDEAISVAVRKGRGSARDALSALDQVAASGEATDLRPAFIDVLESVAEEDPARAMAAIAALSASGWGPEQLAVELVADLRQGFLLLVAPEVADVVGAERERLADQADRIGLARLVRTIELLGRAQVDMRSAADPLVVLEVSLVRSSRQDLGGADLEQRVLGLERRLAQLESRPAAPAAPTASVPPAPSPPADGSSASLGSWRQRHGGQPKATASEPPAAASAPTPEPEPAPTPDPEPVAEAVEAAPSPAPPSEPQPAEETSTASAQGATAVSIDDVRQIWADKVLSELSGRHKALFRVGELLSVESSVLTVRVPNEPQREQCLPALPAIEKALAQALGTSLSVELVAGSAPPARAAEGAPDPVARKEAAAPEPSDDELEAVDDMSSLTDAHGVTSATLAADKILKAFPGATEEP